MSGPLVGAVLDYALRDVEWKPERIRNGLAVLTALAERAPDAGGPTWPSQRELARRTRLAERTVRRLLRDLEQVGEIVGEHRVGEVTRWHVRPGRRLPEHCYPDASGNPGQHSSRGTPVAAVDAPPVATVAGVPATPTPVAALTGPPVAALTAHPGPNGNRVTAIEPPTSRQPPQANGSDGHATPATVDWALGVFASVMGRPPSEKERGMVADRCHRLGADAVVDGLRAIGPGESWRDRFDAWVDKRSRPPATPLPPPPTPEQVAAAERQKALNRAWINAGMPRNDDGSPAWPEYP
jgi:hypothetical protein